ncbi:MAG: Rieske 2Fe-2S domain-containing protein [Hyphomonadaceae bacterium]|nr:Rieske 2Fe-2S domain-containing protein [Hyphomonadaceae bacterium]
MLSVEDNERLTRVGPGTPGGAFLRRYWQPACLSQELPEHDGPPVRVRLLGEDLLAFRNTAGAVGLVDAYCPHRRAPLFFGRNEECGLRCVYHGWKFDTKGDCVDMPSEPADTRLQAKVKLKAYPTVERGGVVWAYLGPPEKQPAPPNYEWLRAAPTHRYVSKTFQHSNYLQALEGGLDMSHSSFLHNERLGDTTETRNRDRTPRAELEATDYGYWYATVRRIDPERNYVRFNHFIMPHGNVFGAFTSPTGERLNAARVDGKFWAPIDDEHTHVYNWSCAYDAHTALTPEDWEACEAFCGRGTDDLVDGTFRLKKNLANDYLIDRQRQKARSFTGIEGLNTQDFALQEGMGPIVDRSQEHLGTSDRAIVLMRRLLRDNIAAVERGEDPVGVDPEASARIRACDAILPANVAWRVALADEMSAKW